MAACKIPYTDLADGRFLNLAEWFCLRSIIRIYFAVPWEFPPLLHQNFIRHDQTSTSMGGETAIQTSCGYGFV
jgi:hypothetical protein